MLLYFEVPEDIEVREFKSIILNKCRKPFFFDYNINDLKVHELIKKSF
jgi:hypothetical protein